MPYLIRNFDIIKNLQPGTKGIKGEDMFIINKLECIRDFTTKIGSWHKAAAIKKKVLEKTKWIFGNEHLNTILAMSNFASTLKDQGKLKEAAAMFREVL